MDENAKRIAEWRAAKEKEWATDGSKLRTKYSTRDAFEAWMARQVEKGQKRINAAGWSRAIPGSEQHEWLIGCYRLRCTEDLLGKCMM